MKHSIVIGAGIEPSAKPNYNDMLAGGLTSRVAQRFIHYLLYVHAASF